MRRFVVVFAISLASLAAAAQPFTIYDLVYSGESGLPTIDVPEPYPWGVQPSFAILSGLQGAVAELEKTETNFSYRFDKRFEETTTSTRYMCGTSPEVWSCNGDVVMWNEGESRFFWERHAKDPRLIEWSGPWSSPSSIKYYRQGLSEPYESWSRIDGDDSKWQHRFGADDSEFWIRNVSAGLVRWTGYDDEGTPLKRLSVTKDAKGTVGKIEYWEDPGKKVLELSIVRTDAVATLKAKAADNAILEIKRSKVPALMVLSSTIGEDYSSETRCTLDAIGRIVDLAILSDGKLVAKRVLSRDATGNLIGGRVFDVDSSFGESYTRERVFLKVGIRYRKAAETGPVLSRPIDLDQWLGKGEKSQEVSLTPREPLDYLPGETKAPGKWFSSVDTDPLTDEKKYYCTLVSSEAPGQWRGPVSLVVRSQAGMLEVFISLKETLEEKSYLALRFDSDQPMYLGPGEWVKSVSGDAAFIQSYSIGEVDYGLLDLLMLIRQRQVLFVQAEKYDGTKVSARFELPGFRAAIEQVIPFADLLDKANAREAKQ